MIEHVIKTATCRISCGDVSGTGWLIARNRIITARHCVLAGLDDGKPVELFFADTGDLAVSSKIVAQSEENDACLLSFEKKTDATPLSASLQLPREGEAWQTFGYPQSKKTLGHRLSGTVEQVLGIPKLKVDLDLSVDPKLALQAYNGMSGAAVVCNGNAVGLIRLKVDGSVAALSLHQIEHFLLENAITFPSTPSVHEVPLLANRGAFTQTFTKAVQSKVGSYLFLEGAHGYGKSTFCANFETDDKTLLSLGTYCLSDSGSALGAEYRSQPQVFLEWLTTTISVLITGKSPRKEKINYADQIRLTAQYLEEFSQFCAKTERRGVLFVDGLNEIPTGPLLNQLIGLLPSTLPSQITVVLTAPNFASITASLGGRVKNNDVFTLPPLPDSACSDYCRQRLKPERRLPAFIGRICEKAKGHPLYLRYLIEYANHQTTDEALDDFPVLTGPIEEYYLGIWNKLLPDDGAVNLLALMARLRWGLPLADFAKALDRAEQIQFVSVISRIRHLLTAKDNSEIYHASFASFIIKQTADIDGLIYRRLTDFCKKEPELRYCVLNRIFHQLRTGDRSVFTDCNQQWVDKSVMLGVEPDMLIADVDEVVKSAVLEASVDESFRLILLSQRISFRYDTLFAQSARLIAEALITLGRPQEAIQHVVRHNTLIVGPSDVIQIGFLLHQCGYDEEALMLLDRVQKRIVETYDAGDLELQHFLMLCSWHIQTLFMMRLAGNGEGCMRHVKTVMDMALRACNQVFKDDRSKSDQCLLSLKAESCTYFLTFCDAYADIAMVKQQVAVHPQRYLPFLCAALLKFEDTVDKCRLSKKRMSLTKLFADLAELVQAAEPNGMMAPPVTDTLVRFGAPASVVELFGVKGGRKGLRPLKIRAKNGVDANNEDLQECLGIWRVAAFLDSDLHPPSSILGVIERTEWTEQLSRLIGALYWYDGKARRAKADGNEEVRLTCRGQLKSQVLDKLCFNLQQRVAWNDSYAIPESVLPEVYRQLAELINDCFPEELPTWLDNLAMCAEGQWGMYSEGFRISAFYVLEQLTREEPSADVAPLLVRLLQRWRDHVLRGVENRHELVLEILRLIPFFTRLGAHEEAERLYQQLLSVSMGPTWYKEDQLSLMNDVLRNVPVCIEVQQFLPQIAGYLEKASGEMTFQRYVRFEKSILLGEIARQGKFRAAVAYFRRQCCGSMAELWAEAQQGLVDKVGTLRGNRFPGGALDDQAAALALVRNSGGISWALRWGLLEIFHCGDDRHLTDYAEAYAKIANEVGAAPELIRRASMVAEAETSTEDRVAFLCAFRSVLKPELHAAFASMLTGLPPPKSPTPIQSQQADNNDEFEHVIFYPGTFGHNKALRDADRAQEEAERQWTLGNRQAAKAQAVRALLIAQEGEWCVWGDLSDSALQAEAMLLKGETAATNVIRYYAPLLAAERYVPKWRPIQHLIGKVGSLLTGAESQQLIDSVIEHVRLMIGDATQEIKNFGFLFENEPEQSPDVEFFRFILWLCNHPQGLRRDRAAAMLLWLVEQLPELFSVAVSTAFSMEEGYGPDVLCGVLDGASAREPVALWDKIACAVDLTKVTREVRHVSRLIVLLRLARRAAEAGSISAKTAMPTIEASFTGRCGKASVDLARVPPWATSMAYEWRQLERLVGASVLDAWAKELNRLCIPLSIDDALALEHAVSTSFRENDERPLNRWKSKLRDALNIALMPYMSVDVATVVESILRIYNPSQPERTTRTINNSITVHLLEAIDSGDYSSALTSSATVLLNYHGKATRPTGDGINYVEVLCLLQPASGQDRRLVPEPAHVFRSSELPPISMTEISLETCCQLEPEVVFFGAFTPATPLPFFQKLVGAKDADFVRQNWRYSRRNKMPGFGCAEREGCSLTIARKAITVPPIFKLAWIVRLNGDVVAFVDEHNNKLS